LDDNGEIDRGELLQVTELLSGIMTELGFEAESFGSPVEVVENLFHPIHHTHRYYIFKDY
jgi:hypothetical protein